MTDDLDIELKELVRTNQSVETSLPDPGIIWWKAEIFRRRQLQEEALKPVVRVQRASLVAVSVLVLAALLFLRSAESATKLLGESSVWPLLLLVAIGFVIVSFWSYRIASAGS
jgi:sterol desaturase/sphingolipid hydroxylase (fatty acid hydroxylase superfamily)